MKHPQEWYVTRAEKLQSGYSGFADIQAIQFAVQAKIINSSVKLTFYYNDPCKYHLSTSGSMVFFTNGKEGDVIMKYYNKLPEKAKEAATNGHTLTQISKPTKVVELKDKGTQACIDHVKKKLATLTKHNPKADNQTGTMLKALIVEFEQYL